MFDRCPMKFIFQQKKTGFACKWARGFDYMLIIAKKWWKLWLFGTKIG